MFVRGLSASDFEVSEDGRRQTVDVFSYVELPRRGALAAPAPPPVYHPEMPRDRRVIGNRLYLLYLGPMEAPHVPRARDLASTFVREYMLPGDLAAVWDPGLPAREIVFTDDRQRLLDAIAPHLGTALGGGFGHDDLSFAVGCASGTVATLPASERERCRYYLRNPRTRLDEALKWFGGIQGRRKSVVLFAGGWPSQADPATSIDVQVYAVDVRGLVAPDRTTMTTRASGDVASVNAELHERLSQLSQSVEGMWALADQTGGFAIINHNEFRDGFARIVDHNSQYYVLGYASTYTRRDGDYRELRVKVNRPGVRVHARRGYYAY
jgi:VWFA-related protein